MSSKIGYARVSTTDQDVAIQVAALKIAGCDVIRQEKASGTSTKGRPELATVLEFIRAGDTLVATRIDRLARSLEDLLVISRTIRERGAFLKCTEQDVDTSTAAGEAFFGMLGVFAQFETALRRERQLEGIAAAKVKGIYKGRPAKLATKVGDQVAEMKASGAGATEIAKHLGIARRSVYRLLGEKEVEAK